MCLQETPKAHEVKGFEIKGFHAADGAKQRRVHSPTDCSHPKRSSGWKCSCSKSTIGICARATAGFIS